jgi:hypothetical protein
MRCSVLLLAVSSLANAGFQIVPCPFQPLASGAVPSSGAFLRLAEKLAPQRGKLAAARACASRAWSAGQQAKDAAAESTAQAALLRFQGELLASELAWMHSQGSVLGEEVGASFAGVWTSLAALMTQKNLMTLPELDALRAPFDVFSLHGQLACLEESTNEALRSLVFAISIHDRHSIRELLARIALGQGDAAAALAHIVAARRMQSPSAPVADRAAPLMLHLQAELTRSGEAALATSGERQVVSTDDGEEDETLPFEALWAEVAAMLTPRLRKLNIALPRGDPLSTAGGSSAAAASSAVVSSASVASTFASDAAWSRIATPGASSSFRAAGYTVLRGLLPDPYFRALLARHVNLFFARVPDDGPPIEHDEPQKRRTLWGEELSLFVGLRLLPAIQAIAGVRLASIYTFSIAYSTGGDLKPHVDRRQNAYSLSLNLGLQGRAGLPPWPLWVSPTNKSEAEGIPISLEPNDALLYGGTDHVHFRKPLTEGTSMQVIFGFRDVQPGHCNHG